MHEACGAQITTVYSSVTCIGIPLYTIRQLPWNKSNCKLPEPQSMSMRDHTTAAAAIGNWKQLYRPLTGMASSSKTMLWG
jgi:hypothetical protein